MGYKILGFVVWKGAKWYARRQLRRLPSRRAAALGFVGLAVTVLALLGARRERPS